MTITGNTIRRILVVEDDYLIANEVAGHLTVHGVDVVGPVGEIDAALEAIMRTERLDGAVVDINLHGVSGFAVADALADRGVPFVFATGYDRAAIPSRFAAIGRLQKPVVLGDLSRALSL